MNAPDDFSGKTLGQYEILEVIGRGGMATVYRARQPSVNRIVAVKVLPRPSSPDASLYARFEREVGVIAHLEHPHIVPIHDHGSADGTLFIAMRYLAGGSIARLTANGLPTPETLEKPLAQVADALDFVHEQGVVHRDLKPGNILLDEHGNAYLSDFGIAYVLGSHLTGSGELLGTPAYMSPEQINGAALDARSDVYSLGIVLFELLTGRPPYQADTPIAVAMKHLNEPMPAARDVRADLSPAVEAVIAKATAKDPNQRYSSAGDLARAYSDALHAPVTVMGAVEDKTARLPEVAAKAQPPERSDVHHAKSPRPKPSKSANRNRERMLAKVRAFWVEGVLDNSLHGAALLELGMEVRPEAVEHPWEMVLQQPEQPDHRLPYGTRIADVFDQMNGELLILGEPGSGKTTTLLELARDLIARAEDDDALPIPVVFNLSSWAEERKPLADWLVDELNAKYQVPKKLGKEWVSGDQIMPLLDGLDEVKADQRDACVEVINRFRGEHGLLPIVVCSRIADYEALTKRLKLQGAIVLQPLTPEQVDTYLASAGGELEAVRAVLEDDLKLQELVESPLMLSIVTLAYRGMSPDDLQGFDTLEGRRNHVFDAYVERMLKRRGEDPRYPAKKVKHWLAWLAGQMSQHAQSVFSIEGLQPDWLVTKTQERFYVFITYLGIGLAAGLIVALTFTSVFGLLFSSILGLTSTLLIALCSLYFVRVVRADSGELGGWAVRIWARITHKDEQEIVHEWRKNRLMACGISPVETLRWSWSQAKWAIVLALAILILYGLTGFSASTLTVAIFFASFSVLLGGLKRGELEMKVSPNQGIRQSIRNALLFGLISAFIGVFTATLVSQISTLAHWSVDAWLPTATVGFGVLYGAIAFGALAVIKHFALRTVLTSNGSIPLNYAAFLDYASSRILLRKVGGGYIFVHRLLMDYFANLEAEKGKRGEPEIDDSMADADAPEEDSIEPPAEDPQMRRKRG